MVLFCLGHCLSKHKMTSYARNLRDMPPGYDCQSGAAIPFTVCAVNLTFSSDITA